MKLFAFKITLLRFLMKCLGMKAYVFWACTDDFTSKNASLGELNYCDADRLTSFMQEVTDLIETQKIINAEIEEMTRVDL
jgi:hypothetical protein